MPFFILWDRFQHKIKDHPDIPYLYQVFVSVKNYDLVAFGDFCSLDPLQYEEIARSESVCIFKVKTSFLDSKYSEYLDFV